MQAADVKPHAHWTRDTTICELTVETEGNTSELTGINVKFDDHILLKGCVTCVTKQLDAFMSFYVAHSARIRPIQSSC